MFLPVHRGGVTGEPSGGVVGQAHPPQDRVCHVRMNVHPRLQRMHVHPRTRQMNVHPVLHLHDISGTM
jgi:hypothetical protein